MKYFIPIVILIGFFSMLAFGTGKDKTISDSARNSPAESIKQLYHELFPTESLSFDAFDEALKKMNTLLLTDQLRNDSILSIIDFSKQSHEQRLFIIDRKNKVLLKNLLVAHGQNSGIHVANKFSNTPSSHMSSLGAYVTSNTYMGKHGYSLRLDGIEKGLNDNARKRAIVMHGANYVSESFIKNNGRIGRSFGCPAISYHEHKEVIDLIKNESCLYIYHPALKRSSTLALTQGKAL